jgi:8-oxo-dGTP pyrophosphatase MutT (NUDIX family)
MTTDAAAHYESLPRRRVGAGALLLDGAGNVLMVEPTYKDEWEIPGGVVEGDEDPRRACKRECLEELGLSVKVGRLLVLEHQSYGPPLGDSMMLVYDGGSFPVGAAITLQADELRSFRFVPAEELGSITVERLARRIQFALLALREGSTVELVNGVRAP